MLLKKNLMVFTILMSLILSICFTTSGFTQETIKIGVIYPMTGPLADVSRQIVDGITLALEVVNQEYSDLNFDLAPTAGLPNLNGAKVEAVVGNTQGQPEFGRAEAERLILVEDVVALLGCYQSGVTKTASQVAERLKKPFLSALSSAPGLTERGFKYFFRSWLTDEIYAVTYMDFFKYLNEEKNAGIKKIGFVAENTDFGVQSAMVYKSTAKEYGFDFGPDIKFPTGTVDLDSEILLLKEAQPDFVVCALTIADGILFTKTAKKLDYLPPGLGGSSSGFADPTVVQQLGEDVDYFLMRGAFAYDALDKFPLFQKVNQMYNDRYGIDMSIEANNAFSGVMIICEAINRAGSTDSEAIQKALKETYIPPEKLTFYAPKGFSFDEKGQRKDAVALLFQMRDGKLRTIFPLDLATLEVIHPIPDWNNR